MPDHRNCLILSDNVLPETATASSLLGTGFHLKTNTHVRSKMYAAAMFLETRETNQGLDKFFTWIEKL